jgi:HAD superfamily phosphoserine phosphatase-like hydrolase
MGGEQQKQRQFAVFDIDGTIARTSLLQMIVKEFVLRGKLDIGIGEQIETLLHDGRQRIADATFGTYMKRAVELLFEHIKGGLTLSDYQEIIRIVVETSLSHTYVYTRQLIETLKRNGFFLIAISGSELRAVEAFSKAIGIDAWLGEVFYKEQNGKLTGEVQTLGQPKDVILKSLIQRFDLTTKGSIAIGDTSSDITMLSLVDQPIVFNPNQALFAAAREKGWMIILERKDMVYGLTKQGDRYILKQTNV